ncbi:MAG TPA: hypothetical protein PLH36_15130, partial [Armatimonadota bacterium]|nr:hypothetical protein [Armatimonadota bacterium]
ILHMSGCVRIPDAAHPNNTNLECHSFPPHLCRPGHGAAQTRLAADDLFHRLLLLMRVAIPFLDRVCKWAG